MYFHFKNESKAETFQSPHWILKTKQENRKRPGGKYCTQDDLKTEWLLQNFYFSPQGTLILNTMSLGVYSTSLWIFFLQNRCWCCGDVRFYTKRLKKTKQTNTSGDLPA